MKIDNNSAENMLNLTSIDQNRPISADTELSKDLKLKAQAEEMEAIFLTKLIKTMEQTIPKSEQSSGNNLHTMMFASSMGKAMAKSGGIGLAKMIYTSLCDKDSDIGDELSKINDNMNQDNTQILNLNNKVF